MQELAGKTAFVTGGASGIGFALGRAFAVAGMNVMLADVETAALAAAIEAMSEFAPHVRGVACDVADPASVDRAAEASFQAFGNVHVVCNNAGVGGGSGIDDISLDTWRWVHRRQPDGRAARHPNLPAAHPRPRRRRPHRQHRVDGRDEQRAGFSPYAASKFAVVNMSEGLATRCAAWHWRDRAVSRVCANAHLGERAQPAGALWSGADAGPRKPGGRTLAQLAELGQSGLDPADVAAQVLAAIRENELYVFTHTGGNGGPSWRNGLALSWRRWTRRRPDRGCNGRRDRQRAWCDAGPTWYCAAQLR